jgi:DNA recombination protein RmuC
MMPIWVAIGFGLLALVFMVLWLLEKSRHDASQAMHQARQDHWQQQLSQRDADSQQRLQVTTQQHATALGTLKQERDEALTRCQQMQTQLTEAMVDLGKLQTDLTKTTEHYAEWQAQLDSQFTQKFELLSQQTLSAMHTQLAQQAETTYTDKQQLLQRDVQSLLDPIKSLLKQQEEKVLTLNDMTIRETTSLKEQIRQSFEQTQALMEAKNRIVSVLTDSKGRGDWGELQLKQLLDASGLMEGVHYTLQSHQQDGGRPDVEIRLPNNRVIFIDAKTLLGTVERLKVDEDTPDTDLRQLNSLRQEIRKLASRDYGRQHAGSVDFVVLYVPRESMLRVPLEQDPNLLIDAMRDNVILASPLILMGLLKVVNQGWQQFEISQNAQQVHKAGQELHRQVVLFLERFVLLEDKIDALHKQYGEVRTALTGRVGVIKKLHNLEKLGAHHTGDKLSQHKKLVQKLPALTLEPDLDPDDDEPDYDPLTQTSQNPAPAIPTEML